MLLANEGAPAVEEGFYVEDFFSAYNFSGNAADRDIKCDVDLSHYGGMVMMASRTSATLDNKIYDTLRPGKVLYPHLTNAEVANTELSSYNSDGFSLTAGAQLNATSENSIAWVFRERKQFFTQKLINHVTGTPTVVDLSTLLTVGMVWVKRTDAAGEWYVWHKNVGASNNLRLTATGQSPTNAYLSVTGTALTIAAGMPSGTYQVYGFASNEGGVGSEGYTIKCGVYTGNGSATGPNIVWGLEPQFMMVKSLTSAQGWAILDTARGISYSGNDKYLLLNSTAAEVELNVLRANIDATQMVNTSAIFNTSSVQYVYMMVAKGLMRQPTDPTKVLDIKQRTGTSAAAEIAGVSVKGGPDLVISKRLIATNGWGANWQSRKRGPASQLLTSGAAAQTTLTTEVTSFEKTGVKLGTGNGTNMIGGDYINYFIREAYRFYESVGYMGTGVAKGVGYWSFQVPDLIMIKGITTASTDWAVFRGDTSKVFYWNTLTAEGATTTHWDSGPNLNTFRVGTDFDVNNNGTAYEAMLFFNCPGVFKCGTYVGTGADNPIDCGFTNGARLVIARPISIAVPSGTLVWDSVRGIVAGNEPLWFLNLTNGQNTPGNLIDPYPAGFKMMGAGNDNNGAGVTYFYMAFA